MKLVLAAVLVVAGSAEEYKKLLAVATYSLSEAIDKAVREAKEGSVVKAELELENGKIMFSADVAQGNKILEVELDAATGKLIATDKEDVDRSALVKAAKISLRKAVEIAIAKTLGKAVKAEFVSDAGKTFAEVLVFAEGRLRSVRMNAETGDV